MSLYLENMRTNYSSWMQVKVHVVIRSFRSELFWERSLLDILKTSVAVWHNTSRSSQILVLVFHSLRRKERMNV